MVEVKYCECSEKIELAGKSVAEAREEFAGAFDIPDKAKAILNGKAVKRDEECQTVLGDDDQLTFKVRSRKGLVAVGALLLALAVSGGLFAYTYTTASVTLGLTPGTSDFATVVSNAGSSAVTWQPFGMYRGSIPAGHLFDVTPATGFNGDLEVDVYLSNVDEMTMNYKYMVMRLELVNSVNGTVDAQMAEHPLTLRNGVVTFFWPAANYTAGDTYYVKCTGGVYMGNKFSGWGQTYNPILFAEVTQAGL